MPNLARYLLEAFERSCRRKWRCRTEARVAGISQIHSPINRGSASAKRHDKGRLVHIALDDEHELLFYSPELLDELPDSFTAEASWVLAKILASAAEIRTGLWRAWFNQTNNKQKEETSHGGSV
jgi:hypothetical protein